MAKGDAPAGPDYSKLLSQQTAANQQAFQTQTQASRPTIIGPTGTSSWTNKPTFDQGLYEADQTAYNKARSDWEAAHPATTTGYDGATVANPGYSPYGEAAPNASDAKYQRDNWTQTITQDPKFQALTEAAARQATPSTQQLPQWDGPKYDSGTRDKYVSDALNAFYSRFNPDTALQEQRLNDRLVQQGINPGTAAYAEQQTLQGRREDDARLQAMAQAQQTGDQMATNEQNRAMQVANANFDKGAQTSQFNASEQQRMLAALIAATGQQQGNGTVATPGYSAPDYLGAANQQYQNQVGVYNADTAANSNLYSGLLGLAGAYFGGPAGAAAGSVAGRQLARG